MHAETSELSWWLDPADTTDTARYDNPMWASVRNHHDMPDYADREDIRESHVPDQFDKLITGLSLHIIIDGSTTATEPAVLAVSDQRDRVIRSHMQPLTPPSSAPVTAAHLDLGPLYKVVCPPNDAASVVQKYIELPEPIHWEYNDLVHGAFVWEDTNRGAAEAYAQIHWERA